MLVEVVIAAMVLTVGILGLVGAFNSSRKLTLLSERRTAMAHRAQLEIEKLLTNSYGQLAMAATPAHSSEKANPDYYVSEGATPTYQYGEKTEEAESLVVAGEGVVATSPTGRSCSSNVGACEWAEGPIGGKVYDFVTWHTDKNCGAKCPTAENYKRITVVVTTTVVGGTREPTPIRVSTLIAKPSS
jgi:Tfp pilus assembly protein PilV